MTLQTTVYNIQIISTVYQENSTIIYRDHVHKYYSHKVLLYMKHYNNHLYNLPYYYSKNGYNYWHCTPTTTTIIIIINYIKKNNIMLSDYKTYDDEPVDVFLDHQCW